ncbi:hypothetical protein HY031_01040 [Candidatus Gottesmanbacteria bacterium]|nr:hypothetical protein [Candidatus Gottesmanbacteria bacterium]
MERPAQEHVRNNQSGQLEIVVVIIVVAAAAAYALFSQKLLPLSKAPAGQPTETSTTPSPTPTPTKLFHGKDSYTISRGSAASGPSPTKLTLDPLDPEVGSNQTFAVEISHTYPVVTAFLSIRTDTKTTKVPLSLVSGTAQKGTWQGSWTVPETYLYNYIVTITAQSASDQSSVPVAIRSQP